MPRAACAPALAGSRTRAMIFAGDTPRSSRYPMVALPSFPDAPVTAMTTGAMKLLFVTGGVAYQAPLSRRLASNRVGRTCEVDQRGAQLREARRLAEHAVDVGRNVLLVEQPLTPAGQQNDGRGRRHLLDRCRHLAPVYARHAEIGDHQRVFTLGTARCRKGVDAGLSAERGL